MAACMDTATSAQGLMGSMLRGYLDYTVPCVMQLFILLFSAIHSLQLKVQVHVDRLASPSSLSSTRKILFYGFTYLEVRTWEKGTRQNTCLITVSLSLRFLLGEAPKATSLFTVKSWVQSWIGALQHLDGPTGCSCSFILVHTQVWVF